MNTDDLCRLSGELVGRDQLAVTVVTTHGRFRGVCGALIFNWGSTLGTVKSLQHIYEDSRSGGIAETVLGGRVSYHPVRVGQLENGRPRRAALEF